jgi:hypothetical protein
MEPSSFVACPVCGKDLSSLSTKHLKSHNLTVKQLRELYPDVKIHSDASLQKKKLLDAKYREKNKEKLNEYFINHRLENKDKRNNYQKEYRKENIEYVKQKNKEYVALNKEKKKAYDKQYLIDNREKKSAYGKEYRKNNKEKIKENAKLYNQKTPHVIAWRRILKNSLRDLHNKKTGKTIDMLGYSALEFKEHITNLFTDGMTWDNYGEWHIDHIKQIISFPPETPASVVNALSNLRPMWGTTREINGVIYEGNLNRPKYNENK